MSDNKTVKLARWLERYICLYVTPGADDIYGGSDLFFNAEEFAAAILRFLTEELGHE